MHIRPSTLADAPGVTTLLGRSYPAMMAVAYEPQVLAGVLPLITRANPDLLACGTFYVAEEGGIIVGCGGWTFAEPGTGKTAFGLAHIRHFAVDPDQARRGIGRAIFEACARTAAAEGAERFQALSALNAQSFYETMGLKRIEDVRVPMGSDIVFPAALMEGAVEG